MYKFLEKSSKLIISNPQILGKMENNLFKKILEIFFSDFKSFTSPNIRKSFYFLSLESSIC